MLRRAEAAVSRSRLDVELVPAAAERLPFPDQSFDTVVATLVFCSVEDQAAALSEVRRVLKPGGTFRFMEHVRAETPFKAWLQDVSTPVWKCFGAGCRPNRDTIGAIRRAGFELDELERLYDGFPLYVGVARPS
jgi:ubiquinone/menaquinone biosynthesis C-methylase UbiE